MKKLVLSLLLVILYGSTSIAQEIGELSVQKIMRDPAWIGHSPDNFYWGENNDQLFFNWNPQDHPDDSLYAYNFEKGEAILISHEEELKYPDRRGIYNKARTEKLFIRDGNLYLSEIKTGNIEPLIESSQRISNTGFLLDEQKIFYVVNNNIFTWDRKSGKTRQLVEFSKEAEPKEKSAKKSDKEEWLNNQQLELFSVLKENKERKEKSDEYKESIKSDGIPTIYLDGKRLIESIISPDGNYVIYRLYISPKGDDNTIVPDYVTESGYTKDLNARSKVGGEQAHMELGVFNLKTRESKIVNIDEVEGLKQIPEFWSDYPERKEEDFESRKMIFQSPLFSDDGNFVVIDARATDNKDRWLFLLNPETAKLDLVDRQRDEAWIAGPGVGYAWGGSTKGFLADNKTLYFQSEESGYSHLYSVDLSKTKKKKKQLTKGEFEIYDVNLSNDKNHFYFLANPESPGIRNLYKLPVSGGKMEQLTSDKGGMEYALAPDESKIAIRKSTAAQPWELYVMDNQPNAEAKRITNSISDEFKSYDWRTPEYITFEAEDGAEVHARLYQPEGGSNGKPAVIFVHGAGYLQNAHQWWSSYFREYMFHNLLADNGYTVLDIDYRGSAGYGRDWRTGIYRHMGGKDLSDQVDGAKYLVDELGVDEENIGIYGGSYGGFITLMALFNEAETFKSGAALRSVTDWAHYNHGYTSNILNTPVDDPIAYERSSPIYFAEGLEGNLLIAHGMVDTNVHFQDVVRLSQRLIELGKENWEMAVYPVESHGFVEPSSWTDEYRRIFELFEDTLKE
ncbi:peptidase S9 [Marivirga tractuosa]|uniref:Peptidase S9B dipeptidylpeptidase IV domain protein n=1 Tax=Marivirga tractuosa (strain ATCC 23168 / DSM 4126 / NBRC 15989 / NCIMB 1408 / VKM B-1430 / H-43) TaxID=643867 RepID=E4TSQ2_MARTH|nr:alpha/beta fold hydrolase [Marivirga tractuosa]ADR21862.1 peptidase S9B dipeptidylpeptidase IV domain protein [Marivirga tractuosa DSM 4126]BDD13680.1 peptidase S9 [Marivirga tractuosa]